MPLTVCEPVASLIVAGDWARAGGDGWIHQGLLLHDAYQDVSGAVKAGSGQKVMWTGNGSHTLDAFTAKVGF